jgi:GH24 family phage-related lysozyme (muramidase)
MPSKNQKQSEYLESLKANVPEQKNSQYLEQEHSQQSTSNKLDDQFFKSKEAKPSNKKEKKDSIDSRVDKFSKVTGSKPFTYANLTGSFVKPIGKGASKLSATTPVSEHLLGSAGGYYQGGIKSISSAKNVGRSLQRQKYQDQLGTAGKIDQGYRALTNAARLSYSANILSGLSGLATGQGGSITPGSSLMGKLTPMIGGVGTAGLMGAGVASSMISAGKMRKIMVMKKTPDQLSRKTAKGTNLDPFYRILRNEDQIQPMDQLQYMLMSYIEEHTSVLPSIYSDLDFLKQQKEKASKQVDIKLKKETSDESESILNKVENAINTVVTKYDPISQLSTFIFGGGNPKKVLEDIQKGRGLYGKELEETKQEANLIGVSTNQFRLLDLSSQSLAATGQSYEAKMFALASASYDISRLIAQETATIRKHGFGVEHNIFNRPISKKGLFAKIENLVTSIPGLAAGYNIVKDLILLPKKANEFFKGMFSKGADFIFGKDFLRFQKQEELDKELGFTKSAQEKSTEFMAEGLPNLLEKSRTLQAQQLDIQYNIFDVLKDSYNLAYTQATGQASGRGYKQFVSADSMSERIWDAVESKMLTAEGMEQALQKRQDLRQLEREKTFKKGILGKFAAINEITPGGKREIYEQMDKYLSPINTLNENFNNLLGLKNKFGPFKIDQGQKDWERSTDIRRSIRRDDYVRQVGIEGEREKQKADWQTGAIGATNLIVGGGLAAVTGGMSIPITAAITTAAQAIFNQIDENEEFNQILEEQGGFRRVITSVEDELNKRSNIVDRNFSSEINIPNRTSLNNESIVVLKDLKTIQTEQLETQRRDINQLTSLNNESIVVLKDLKTIQTEQLETQRNIFELLSDSFDYVKENISKIVEKISSFGDKSKYQMGTIQLPTSQQDITQQSSSNIIELSNYLKTFNEKNISNSNESSNIKLSNYLETLLNESTSNKISNYEMGTYSNLNNIIEANQYQEDETKQVVNGQPIITRFAKDGGILTPSTPFTLVGDATGDPRSTELAVTTRDSVRIYNKEQTKEIFGLDMRDLINNPNIKKLAEGGEIPISGSKAADYSIFVKIGSKLDNLVVKVSDLFTQFKENRIFAALEKEKNKFVSSIDFSELSKTQEEDNISKAVSIGDKLKEDKQQQLEKEERQFQNSLVTTNQQVVEKLDELNKTTKKLNSKDKDSFLGILSGLIPGLVPLLMGGAALGTLFATDFKIGKTAVAGLVGKITSNIFTTLTKVISKTGIIEKYLAPQLTKVGAIIGGSNIGKLIKELGTRVLVKLGFKFGGKVGLTTAAKLLGRAIPGLGMIFGGYFAAKKLLDGDPVGALIEFSSGVASIFPGVGTAISLGLSVWSAIRDAKREKAIEDGTLEPFDPTNAVSQFLKIGGKLGFLLFGKLGFKSLLKKIPVFGALAGTYFAYKRIKENADYLGGLMEFASGLTSLAPGVGIPISLGLDALIAIRDMTTTKEERQFSGINLNPSGFIESLTKTGSKLFAMIFKGSGKLGLKTLAKKIPLFGALAGTYFAYQRFQKKEYGRGVLEFVSGLASIAPGIGMPISFGLDALLMIMDQTDSKTEDETGQTPKGNFFSNFAHKVYTSATQWINSKLLGIPIFGSFYRAFIENDDIEVYKENLEEGKFELSNLFFKVRNMVDRTFKKIVYGIPFIGGILKSILSQESSNELQDLVAIEQYKGNDVNLFDLMKIKIKQIARESISSIWFIGTPLANMLFGEKPNIENDLQAAMKQAGIITPDMVGMVPKNDSIQAVFRNAIFAIRDTLAASVAGFPFIGKKLANLISGTSRYNEKEDEAILNGTEELIQERIDLKTGLKEKLAGTYNKTKNAVTGAASKAKSMASNVVSVLNPFSKDETEENQEVAVPKETNKPITENKYQQVKEENQQTSQDSKPRHQEQSKVSENVSSNTQFNESQNNQIRLADHVIELNKKLEKLNKQEEELYKLRKSVPAGFSGERKYNQETKKHDYFMDDGRVMTPEEQQHYENLNTYMDKTSEIAKKEMSLKRRISRYNKELQENPNATYDTTPAKVYSSVDIGTDLFDDDSVLVNHPYPLAKDVKKQLKTSDVVTTIPQKDQSHTDWYIEQEIANMDKNWEEWEKSKTSQTVSPNTQVNRQKTQEVAAPKEKEVSWMDKTKSGFMNIRNYIKDKTDPTFSLSDIDDSKKNIVLHDDPTEYKNQSGAISKSFSWLKDRFNIGDVNIQEFIKDIGNVKHIFNNSDIVEKIKHHIIASEGISLKKYNDSEGYPTIGVGHLISKQDQIPDKITPEEAKEIFERDFRKHVELTSNLDVFQNLSDTRKGALVDMVFNMGLGGVQSFKNSLRLMSEGNFSEAAKSILRSKYATQVGERAERIANIINSDNPQHFSSNPPQIIARYGAFTGAGTSPIDTILHPQEIVFGKGQFQNFLKDIINNVNEIANTKIKVDLDSTKLINHAKQYDQLILDEKLKTVQSQNQNIQTTSQKENVSPIIVDNRSTSNNVTQNEDKTINDNTFTKVDDSLDQIIYNLFNMTTRSLNTSLSDFALNNNFSFDFS